MDDTALDPTHPARVATQAARVGAAVAAGGFRQDIAVETKAGKTDVVTQADRDAQRRVTEAIHAAYPETTIVGEEDEERSAVPEEGSAWIIDPIDGTNNFVRGIPMWCTAVAAVEDGEPRASAIVAHAIDDVYEADDERVTRNGEELRVSDRSDPEACTVVPGMWWEMDRRDEYAAVCRALVERFGDIRRLGSAQLQLAMIADGGLDGMVTNVDAPPWDTLAGVHMVRLAGGTVTDFEGNPWRHDAHGLVASNGAIHDTLLDAAADIEAVSRE